MKTWMLVVLGAALVLEGCAAGSTADPGKVGPYPDNYKQIVATHVRAEFFDPYSMRDVSIAAPFQARLFFQDGWIVCLRANAKNRMGGYTGIQEQGYLIRDGAVVLEGDQANCPSQQYTEWPEMEDAGAKH